MTPRSIIACNRCRGRKTRCAGIPPHPCIACEDAGSECVYSEAEKRVSISESALRQLQAQAQAQSARVQDEQPGAGPAGERDDWWYGGADHLFLDRAGEHHFVGPSSATHLARRLHPSSSSTHLAWDVRPLYDAPLSPSRSWSPPRHGPSQAHSLPPLPPWDFAKRLFCAQYSYIGTIFSLITPHDFERRLAFVYAHPHQPSPSPRSRDSSLVHCQVLLVFALGLMYSVNQWSGDSGPPGFQYFVHALRFLPEIHAEGSIFFVEVLCYVAYYMQNLNRRDAAFLYIGLALRMAISLGLHQEVAANVSISAADRNRRRRAWWSVYSLDRLLCVKSGNPITIQDEDIGTAWPDERGHWPSVVLTQYTLLSRILGRIGEEVYRRKPRSGSTLLSSVQSITNELSHWLDHVPDRLRIDFADLDTHVQSREKVSLFLHFYSCVNMTARPLVFYVIQRRLGEKMSKSKESDEADDWRNGLSPNTVRVIASCITAARATTLIMDAAARRNLVATYGYLDGEYIFSAALLLVMVNAAFPPDDANARTMEAALGILKGMAEKGNTYLGSRHALLLELRGAIGRGQGDQDENDEREDEGSSYRDTVDTATVPATAATATELSAAPAGGDTAPPGQPLPQDLPDMSFDSMNFDINDDPGLWEEVLDRIDIDMDTDWIENTLRGDT